MHVDGPSVKGLLLAGWDVVRVVDAFLQNTDDDVLFERAAEQQRVFVTNDKGLHRTAVAWMREGREFRGIVFWRKEHHQHMTTGELIEAFDEIAAKENAFSYPIEYIKPKS